MMQLRPDGSTNRRGVVLLVVISLLTLFAVLGLSFVMYANTTAEGSRLMREAETAARPDVEPELLLSLFLGQLLYDAADDQTGVYSALRGHSLARSMFGLKYDPSQLTPDRTMIAANNAVPYNGTGRLRVPITLATLPLRPTVDDYHLVNYQLFRQDGFLRDPERPGLRTPDIRREPWQWGQAPFVGGFNAPYTYPDLNNMFLAAVKADGMVMLPSFHRPWTGFGPLDPSNPNWRDPNPLLKYKVLRPRPADHAKDANDNPLFPFPQDAGGDVKNLVGFRGGNDSIWIDLDAPVMTAPDGRKYKALFAPLIMDLDNRVNLNVHGNARGAVFAGPRITGRMHTSNQGWGPWEVNPGYLADPNVDPSLGLPPKFQEWTNLVTGTAAPLQRGRLSPAGPPFNPPIPPGLFGRVYSMIDLDGANELTGAVSDAPRLPGTLPSLPWQAFPSVAPGYGNGSDYEKLNHSMQANPFAFTAGNYNFPLSNVEALLRYGDTGSPALSSELFRLAAQNLGGDRTDPQSFRRRNLVTVHSCDVDRPGVVPFFWKFPIISSDEYLTMPTGRDFPTGAKIPFPRLTPPAFDPWREADFTWSGNPLRPDLRTADHLSRLRRLDLNRPLPPYPDPDASGMIPANRMTDFQVAQRARQIFAEELFERLWRLTGAGDPLRTTRSETNRWDALRWLAQLAVNIVDFIDADEYMTPLLWAGPVFGSPAEWVFGTELPRLVINEVYAQCDSDRNTLLPRDRNPPETIVSNAVSFWVELHNPLTPDRSMLNGGAAMLRPYKLTVCANDPSWTRNRQNVWGLPTGIHLPEVTNLAGPDMPAVLPLDPTNQYAGPWGRNTGFYVVGADLANLPQPVLLRNPPVDPPMLPTSHVARELTYRLDGNQAMGPFTMALRRLASPHLPPNDDQSDSLYNPYITVDYMKDIRPNDCRVWVYRPPTPEDPPGNPPVIDGPLFLEYGDRRSVGRNQPYAAAVWSQQQPRPWPDAVIPDNMPRNSFFQYNVHGGTPGVGLPNWPSRPHPDLITQLPAFDWLVHLDRPLISPMELLHVSAYKPHELTQRFVDGAGSNKHRAPWFDDGLASPDVERSPRLSRVLEFLTTGHLAAGMRTPLGFNRLPLTGSAVPVTGSQSMTIAVDRPDQELIGPTASGGSWQIMQGSSLLVGDPDIPNSVEVVRVTGVAGNVIQAFFLRTHRADVPVRPLVYSDRIPGKINVNTIWDEETFLALCDPQQANEFNWQEIKDIYQKFMEKRTPGLGANRIAEEDRPILSMSVGNAAKRGDFAYDRWYPRPEDQPALFQNGSGLDDTFFRSTELDGSRGTPRLFQNIGGLRPDFPYFQNQLLHKTYNHLTTRSNVFAVWLTVGFFEVKDDGTFPVKLGRELVNPDGKTIRHRMFAVVDRSVMTANPGPQPRFRVGSTPDPRWANGLVVPYYSIIQ